MTSNPASVGPAPDGPLPCPFCGAKDRSLAGIRANTLTVAQVAKPEAAGFIPYWAVQCEGCVSEGPPKDTKSEAVAAWNTRAPRPDREAEPTGGVVDPFKLPEVQRLYACLNEIGDDHERCGSCDQHDDLLALVRSAIHAAALSVSPPVVEGSSLRDTQPGSADRWASLEAKARKCTEGDPWYSADDLRGNILGVEVFIPQDRAFIAAANPETVLKLIEATRHQADGGA